MRFGKESFMLITVAPRLLLDFNDAVIDLERNVTIHKAILVQNSPWKKKYPKKNTDGREFSPPI